MRIFLLMISLVLTTGFLSAQQLQGVSSQYNSEQTVFDKEKDPDIKIFPVPVLNKRFTITSDIPFKYVRMTNIIGQEIIREKLVFPVKRKEIEILGSEKGIYLVTIELEDNRKIVRKIMVDSGR